VKHWEKPGVKAFNIHITSKVKAFDIPHLAFCRQRACGKKKPEQDYSGLLPKPTTVTLL
jgi:hypothetical protein